jgi:hypothetical protein
LPLGRTNTTLGPDEEFGNYKPGFLNIGSLNVRKKNKKRLSDED